MHTAKKIFTDHIGILFLAKKHVDAYAFKSITF